MGKRPKIGEQTTPASVPKLPTNLGAETQVEEVTAQVAQTAAVTIKPPKKKPGRPRKFDQPPHRRVVLLPEPLDKLVQDDANSFAAGNISATLLKIIADHYKFDLKG